MHEMKALRKQWNDEARFRPFHAYPHISEDGLLLGCGTRLVAMAQDSRGGAHLRIDGREERVLALLSLAYRMPISVDAVRNIKRASMQWARGEKALAHFELAFARLPRLADRQEGWLLFCADALFKQGIRPRWYMRYLGLDVGELDLLKHSREQPRVPAGNGRESGRWTSDCEGSDVGPDLAPGIRGHVDLITESKPARLLPRRRYAQSLILPDIPDGTPVEPYGELNTSLSKLPSGSKQVLQWRFFVQDDKTKQWHVGARQYGVEGRNEAPRQRRRHRGERRRPQPARQPALAGTGLGEKSALRNKNRLGQQGYGPALFPGL